MKSKLVYGILSIALGVALFGCAERMATMEKGDKSSNKRTLITAEQSEFKQAVVQRIAETLEKEGGFVKVADVKSLLDESMGDYQAIVIVSTCKASRLNRRVRKFLESADEQEKQKIILLTTAGGEDWQANVPGVDAITSASKMGKADAVAETVIEKVRAHLVSQ